MTRKNRTGYLYRRGSVYWLQYSIDGQVIRQSLDTTSKTDAEKQRKEIMRPFQAAGRADALSVIAGQLKDARAEQAAAEDEANPPLAIVAAWDAYYDSENRPDSSERTLAGYESAWKRFFKWMKDTHPDKMQVLKPDHDPEFIMLMREVTAETAAAYAKKLQSDGVTASTFNQHIGLMRLMWRVLAKAIRAESNPWLEVSRKKLGAQKVAHRRQNLTPEQFDTVLKCAGRADLHDLIFTLAWTGQRLADVVLMKWNAIDFKRHIILVHPLKLRRTGKQVTIPLLPELAALLKMRKGNAAGPLVFPELAEDYQRDTSSVSKRISAAFDKADLNPRETMPGVKRSVAVYGAHSLRHYFATQALAAGLPSDVVRSITGHTSDGMLNHYQHVDARLIGELASKLQAPQKAIDGEAAALPPHADAVPGWIADLLRGMNAKNWKSVKDEILKAAS